ncbi:outer membrane immunogenic protein [Bosea lupini]|uniref:Outer membrane immunogenic protein n=1 Tax=Bosea lupini TaxID=1036779 RepID=A0A1H7VQS0_9HYPH|nr:MULTISPECIES: outer membrane protein [Bosea]SEM11239.1 outer membrane immunogenic protein [Bosea lupini]
MIRTGLLASLAIAGLSGAAFAADLPSRKGPVLAPIAPIFTWTGFYVGVHAGAVFTDNNIQTEGTAANTIANVAFSRRPPSLSVSDTGFIGGAQVGYNYQIGQIVLGAEADFSYTDLKKRESFIGTTNATSSFRQEMEYFGTVRLRAGYAFDRLLVFATGGLAYGDVKNSATFFSAAVPGQVDYVGSRDNVEIGWTVGGGLEYAFTNNLSVKAEYLYYDLGKRKVPVNLQPVGPAGGSYVSRFENTGHIVRAGLNYRFSTF